MHTRLIRLDQAAQGSVAESKAALETLYGSNGVQSTLRGTDGPRHSLTFTR